MASVNFIETVIDTLAAAYDKRIDETRRAVYVRMLADLPEDALLNAAEHVIATCTFFPSVAEIRAAAGHLQRAIHAVPSPEEAWAEMITQARAPREISVHCGEYARLRAACEQAPEDYLQKIAELREHELGCTACHTVTDHYQWSHPLVGQVAARMGWPDKFWTAEIGVIRSQYMRAYAAQVERLTGEAIMLPEVRQYVLEERESQHARLEERRAALETGEVRELAWQLTQVSRGRA